ncbi:hypothetical protein Tco_1357238, partial [Tanacetum coccineum]
TALNDHLKGIQMQYLPQTIWRQSDRDKAGVMIQAIDKQLKTRRIMRSLEKFIGGRPYEDKTDSMHSTLSMYYDYDAHVKGELLDYDGIPKRSTMFLNLWSYKVVRHRYSNPMIQPEPEGSTQGYPLDSVEVLRYDTKGEKFDEFDTYVLERFDTLVGNPVKEILLKLNIPDHRVILADSKVTPTKHGRMTKPYSPLALLLTVLMQDI